MPSGQKPVTSSRRTSSNVNTSTAIFYRSAPDLAACPDESMPEFAFAGRSNVGKSSLLNMLVGKRDLARVSATPGHTKHLNFFTVNGTWRLVDLPGYGYAKVERKERGRFSRAVSEYLAERPNLRCVFALVDGSLPPQGYDLEFVEWMADNEVPFVLVFSKTDKVGPVKLQETIAAFTAKLAEWSDRPPEILTCSAVDRVGRAELLAIIDSELEPEQKKAKKAVKPKLPLRATPW